MIMLMKLLFELPTEMIGKLVAPASNHLFEHCEDQDKLLTPELSEQFCHLLAKALFLSKRARPDL